MFADVAVFMVMPWPIYKSDVAYRIVRRADSLTLNQAQRQDTDSTGRRGNQRNGRRRQWMYGKIEQRLFCCLVMNDYMNRLMFCIGCLQNVA
jgi:hypothetical protein